MAEGLELGEKISDAVTFAIEMLVKGGFLRSAGIHSYDGEGAELRMLDLTVGPS